MLHVYIVEMALKINSLNETAHVVLAFVHMFYKWDFEKGTKYARDALKINHKGSDANIAMALYHILFAEWEMVLAYIEAASDIDPLSTNTNRTLADSYYFMGEYNKALEIYEWIIEREPDFLAAKEFKGWTLLMMGEFEEAIAIFNSIKGETTHAIKPFVQLGYAYAKKGDKEKARFYLQ